MVLAVLKLGKGNWQTGFPTVSVQLWETDDSPPIQLTGSLPPAPELSHLYTRWRSLYQAVSKRLNWRHFEIEFDEEEVTQVSDKEFAQLSEQLKINFNHWLDTAAFNRIERKLRTKLHVNQEIRLILEIEDEQLRRFPWHLWHFLDDYIYAEIAISPQEYVKIEVKKRKLRNKVRILAILGNSQGIDVERDRILLTQLPNTEIVFLVEPKRQEFDRCLWDETGWDILFFAGHSCSYSDGMSGQLEINSQDTLTIPQLKNALKKAITNGLKLAIFNSCDGLGLARQLADLSIPYTIVMRESVPDIVAQAFLKHFLNAFSQGKSFYLAVREARERLQGLEDSFLCASWLPIIYQNPAENVLSWQKLINKSEKSFFLPPHRLNLRQVALVSMTATLLTIGMRWLGVLQGWELKTYDQFMQQRLTETPDSRLLIIGIDEEDINQYGYPLPDKVLLQLLNKVQSEHPRVIGVDIFRDHPIELKNSPNIVAICAFGDNLSNSIAPPPQFSSDQIGFVDLYDDRSINPKDDTIRRYLFSRSPNILTTPSRCNTPYSFALQLAYRYLTAQGITVTAQGENWQLGNIVIKPLENHSAGYHQLDARGNQFLINYRNTPQIAQQLTIRDILQEDYFNRAWVKDKIVLIGITAASVPDTHDTPYGELRGIYLHAHVTSQLLSAVSTEQRSLVWWLPQWGDAIFVSFWAFISGLMSFYGQGWLKKGFVIGVTILLLYGVCWFILLQGGWLPFIPSLLAIVMTSASLIILQMYKKYFNLKTEDK